LADLGYMYSGRFTHISGHASPAGRAQDRESSPARDRRSTTVPRHQLGTQMSRAKMDEPIEMQTRAVCPRNHEMRCTFRYTAFLPLSILTFHDHQKSQWPKITTHAQNHGIHGNRDSLIFCSLIGNESVPKIIINDTTKCFS